MTAPTDVMDVVARLLDRAQAATAGEREDLLAEARIHAARAGARLRGLLDALAALERPAEVTR